MRKILVIDDIEGTRDSIRRTLETNGYEVVTAANGEAGLDSIEKHAPDLVITDILMPEMDGLLTIRNIARNRPDLPVIVMTGSIETHYFDAALSFGASEGLFKPFSREKLLSTVRKVLYARETPPSDSLEL